ncbi:hypothetical protein BKN51_08375 [Amycolatopsis sp. BJA-103]|nr:hypothetical protein BKN51_08375 [Amycolatopsis sp. BJA-103]
MQAIPCLREPHLSLRSRLQGAAELQIPQPPVHAFPAGRRIDEVQLDPGVVVPAPQVPHVFRIREVADLAVHDDAHHLESAVP